MKRKFTRIVILTFGVTVSVLSINVCLKGSSGKVLPFLPNDVSLNPANYTPENVGLLSVTGTSPSGQAIILPAISDNERTAIGESLKQLNDLGMMDTGFMAEASRTGRSLLAFQPLSDAQLDDQIMADLKGEAYPEPAPPSDLAIREREARGADLYYSKIEESFPTQSKEELIAMRTSLTISLVTLRLQLDFNDKINGIPEETLIMVRTKTVAMREKISKELIRRGISSI